jgi:hypothetical protein
MEDDRRGPDVSIASSSPLSSTHASSHHLSPLNRGEPSSWRHHRPQRKSHHLLLFVLLTCFLSFSTASIYISDSLVEFDDIQDLEVAVDVPEGYRSAEEASRLALSGPLLVDLSPPPKPADWTLASLPDDLKRRNVDDNDSSSVTSSSSSSSSTSNLASTTTSSGLAVATTASAYPLPTPFDIGFSSNITANCAQFMNSMLSNATFQQCLPFSLLLQVRATPPLPLQHN